MKKEELFYRPVTRGCLGPGGVAGGPGGSAENDFQTFLEAIFSLSCTEMSLTGTVYAQQIHTFRTLITEMSVDNFTHP